MLHKNYLVIDYRVYFLFMENVHLGREKKFIYLLTHKDRKITQRFSKLNFICVLLAAQVARKNDVAFNLH